MQASPSLARFRETRFTRPNRRACSQARVIATPVACPLVPPIRMSPRSNDKLSRLEIKIKLNARLPMRQKADLFGANILANKISLPRAGLRAGATLKENTKYLGK